MWQQSTFSERLPRKKNQRKKEKEKQKLLLLVVMVMRVKRVKEMLEEKTILPVYLIRNHREMVRVVVIH